MPRRRVALTFDRTAPFLRRFSFFFLRIRTSTNRDGKIFEKFQFFDKWSRANDVIARHERSTPQTF